MESAALTRHHNQHEPINDNSNMNGSWSYSSIWAYFDPISDYRCAFKKSVNLLFQNTISMIGKLINLI